MRQWRLIYGLPAPGKRNMAIDEAILRAEQTRPTLRLYAWEPFCLSLGYGQRMGDVDCSRLNATGYDLVRRPTGGRAILHACELTYSLILPPGHPVAEGGIIPSYRRISRALVNGLETMGIALRADEGDKPTRANGPVCFDAPSHYEITASGRKLLGSAQLRRKIGVLQHGSLPLSGDLAAICDVLCYPDEASREAARQHVRQQAITLAEVAGGSVSWQAAAEAIVRGFQTVFEVDFEVCDLTEEEHSLADQLTDEIYGNSHWTARR